MSNLAPAELVERMNSAIADLVTLIERTPDERWTLAPVADEWTAAEICGHICELVPYWTAAAEALATAPGSSFGRELDDPDRVGAVRTGAGQSRELAATRLQAAAAAASVALLEIPIETWSSAGVSASRGPMTVREIIEMFIVGHVRGHVAQVRAALGEK